MQTKNIKILITFFFLILVKFGFASHFRAGEILYEYLGPLTYRATVITYAEDNLANQDQDSVSLYWGDGTIENIPRTNGALGSTGVPSGELLPGTGIRKNIYISTALFLLEHPVFI
mgnify:FL=1